MYLQSLYLKNDKLQRSVKQRLEFTLRITGAKTNAPYALTNLAASVLTGYDAADLTQALVEAFLGHTSSAACATIFDATSMGTDTIGLVINMSNMPVQGSGQALTLYGMETSVIQTAGGTPANAWLATNASQAALTSSNTTACALYDGDIYARLVNGNLDSATAGFIKFAFLFDSK